MYNYKAKDEDGDIRRTGYYGQEVALDLHGCDTAMFTRESLKQFLKKLCELIDMKAEDLHFWDDEGVPEEEKQTLPHTKGISAVQFILTSSITIHCLTDLRNCYINVFSCADFDSGTVKMFAWDWFKARMCGQHDIMRM